MNWVLIGLIIVVGCFALGALLGAPFLPVRKRDAEAALDLAGVKKGQTVIDLGSGDGILLRAAAHRGAQAIGYEINPLLVFYSRLRCWRYRKQIRIHLGDYWRAELPPADVIYMFLITHYTDRMDKKLTQELTQTTLVVSYVFDLPRKAIKQTRNTKLYRYP